MPVDPDEKTESQRLGSGSIPPVPRSTTSIISGACTSEAAMEQA